jgi:hypothetical protein
MSKYTINSVSKAGGQWQVLEWTDGEWAQVGPYYDTEAEAEAAIKSLQQ